VLTALYVLSSYIDQICFVFKGLNTVLENHKATERSYIQCGAFSKQWKLLKYSPLEERISALAAGL
jgi:hypothetical protein